MYTRGHGCTIGFVVVVVPPSCLECSSEWDMWVNVAAASGHVTLLAVASCPYLLITVLEAMHVMCIYYSKCYTVDHMELCYSRLTPLSALQ